MQRSFKLDITINTIVGAHKLSTMIGLASKLVILLVVWLI